MLEDARNGFYLKTFGETAALPILSFQLSSLQNCERITFSYWKQPVLEICFRDTPGK
jgi:hypothetical protein